MRYLALIAGVIVLALGSPRSAHAASLVRAEDLFKIRNVSSTAISPDGRYVAFVLITLNGPQNRYDRNIWIVDASTARAHPITTDGRDGEPTWSPDGNLLAFSRGAAKGRPQIYVYDFKRSRTRKLTNLKSGATGPLFSHNGKMIAFSSSTVEEQPNAQIDFAAAGFKPKKNQLKSDVTQTTQLHYRANGAGEIYRYHQHIWVMNADGSHPRALTSGIQWSENGYTWSRDDRMIGFNSLRREDPALGPSDIFEIPVAGGAMRKVPLSDPSNNIVTFGNTSDTIYSLSSGVADPAEYASLVSVQPDGSRLRTIVPRNTIAWGDAIIGDMKEGGGGCAQLTPDDKSLITVVSGPGYAQIVSVDLASAQLSNITGVNGEAFDCAVSTDGKTIAYVQSDFTHPSDLYILRTGEAPRRLTSFNDAYLAGVRLSVPQPFTVRDDAGFTVHAWFMPATGGNGATRKPTVLDIHGGPETEFGNSFFHEFQYLAAQGYNVVFSDPRGSPGFGYAFEEALAKSWGEAMFNDVMNVMDAAVQRPDVDTSRLGVSGGSYGGYATLWVISHTDRFKVAIAERVVSNLATEQTVADLTSTNALGGAYSWGLPWEANNLYAKWSPITYVTNVHTPLLILHSTEDIRTPEDQTLQEYTSLKMLGRTVKFVEFPGENHDLSRTGAPIHRVERLHILGDWLKSYLLP